MSIESDHTRNPTVMPFPVTQLCRLLLQSSDSSICIIITLASQGMNRESETEACDCSFGLLEMLTSRIRSSGRLV